MRRKMLRRMDVCRWLQSLDRRRGRSGGTSGLGVQEGERPAALPHSTKAIELGVRLLLGWLGLLHRLLLHGLLPLRRLLELLDGRLLLVVMLDRRLELRKVWLELLVCWLR